MEAITTRRGRPRMNPLKEALIQVEAEESGEIEAPDRPNPRGDLREADPRAAAAIRARQLLERLDDNLDGITDDFYIDPAQIPPGWSYEWKTRFVLGAEDPARMIEFRRMGWEEVPAKRHPELLPLGSNAQFIERKGQILMERPAEITNAIRAHELSKARADVQVKIDQLNGAPQGHFERSDPRVRPKIKHTYEAPIPIHD